jgi:hypothetical protein
MIDVSDEIVSQFVTYVEQIYRSRPEIVAAFKKVIAKAKKGKTEKERLVDLSDELERVKASCGHTFDALIHAES